MVKDSSPVDEEVDYVEKSDSFVIEVFKYWILSVMCLHGGNIWMVIYIITIQSNSLVLY